jgi:hypothetical protein
MPTSFLDSATSTFGSINELSGDLAVSRPGFDGTTMQLVASEAQHEYSVTITKVRGGFTISSVLTEPLVDQKLAKVKQPVNSEEQRFINEARSVLLGKPEARKRMLDDLEKQARQKDEEAAQAVYRVFPGMDVPEAPEKDLFDPDDPEEPKVDLFEDEVFKALQNKVLGLVPREKRRLAWCFSSCKADYAGTYNPTRLDMVMAKINAAKNQRV